jgi:predicted ATPase/DNA-binding SARP family transcriptional activator/uncharacterized protein HemY
MSDDLLSPFPAPASGEATSGLRIQLFGPMEVRIGSDPLPRLRSRKGLWLLALLALRDGREVERDWLAGTLWPECSEVDARRSLRQSLHDLRLALGPEAWRLIGATARTLRLEVSGAFVDVLAFDAALARADRAAGSEPHVEGSPSSPERDALEAAVRLYRGPLLEDCTEEWSVEERQRREQAYLAALSRLAAVATVRGEHAVAASYLRLAVTAEPYQEDLQRALMEALAAGGNPSGALLVYRQFRALLRREMASDPAEETAAVYQRLRAESRARAARPTTNDERPTTAVPSSATAVSALVFRRSSLVASNLPRPLSAFVGRERELQEVSACLTSARLVTLTGTGGIGKTRLAIRLAEESAEDFADGVWFVDLAALADAALVPQAVARTLRVSEAPGTQLTETLQEALGGRQLLLVLDNCEHLIDGCAHLADALLSNCPHLRILATSRQALRLTGEIVWRVPPLSLPDPKQWSMVDGRWLMADGPSDPPLTINHQPSTIMQFAAVRLFLDRAHAVEASFEMTPRNAPAIMEVCRRLEGIPLAIELAAARSQALTPAQMLGLLERCLEFLVSRRRDGESRHRTLRATIDWSYRLLPPELQRFFARLSVFRGGWTPEAAEAVCSEEGVGRWALGVGRWALGLETDNRQATSDPDPTPNAQRPTPNAQGLRPNAHRPSPNVLNCMEQLLDNSLILAEATGERSPQAMRFRMLEMLREFANDQLEPEERAELAQRHAAYFLAMVEEEYPPAEEPRWLERLDVEHDNLRAALSWALTAEEETALRLAAGLRWFWYVRGYVAEGRDWLEKALARCGVRIAGQAGAAARGIAPPASADRPAALRRRPSALAKALNGAGHLARVQGEYETARGYHQAALKIGRELEESRTIADALRSLGQVALAEHDAPTALRCMQEALAIYRALGSRSAEANTLVSLGDLARFQGDFPTARQRYEDGLTLHRELGDRLGIAYALMNLGDVTHTLGDRTGARRWYEEAQEICRETGDRRGIAYMYYCLGVLAQEEGDLTRGRGLLEESVAMRREMGDRNSTAHSLLGLGQVLLRQGDHGGALAALRESLSLFRALGNRLGAAYTLEAFAALAAAQGKGEHAARLSGAAAALRAVVANSRSPADHTYEEGEFAAAWAQGRAMTLEEAIRVALEECEIPAAGGRNS